MTGRRDYYQVLGVPRDADDKTIKNAFRRYRRAPSPVGCCGSRAGACLAISGAAGAAYVTLIVDIPRQLSPRQRQLYEQLRAEDADRKGEIGRSHKPEAPRSGGRLRALMHGGSALRLNGNAGSARSAEMVMSDVMRSPRILAVSWGRMEVEGIGAGKDFKLYPGGGREWDWDETGTRHSPGIQPADVEELLVHGAAVVVLSLGMNRCLLVDPRTLDFLAGRSVAVRVAETREAVRIYNELAAAGPVAGLFHSTC